MSDPAESQVSEAMNRLWQKFLPQMEERVATLKSAADKLASGSALSAEQRSQAGAEAHKLAGVLGTFGLGEGTELAREAEGVFEGLADLDPAKTARLSSIAERLRTMIVNRV